MVSFTDLLHLTLGLSLHAISQRNRFLKNTSDIYTFWKKSEAASIVDEIDRISTGEGFGGKGNDLSSGYNWWRCRDLNPGHCGYEPHALTD